MFGTQVWNPGATLGDYTCEYSVCEVCSENLVNFATDNPEMADIYKSFLIYWKQCCIIFKNVDLKYPFRKSNSCTFSWTASYELLVFLYRTIFLFLSKLLNFLLKIGHFEYYNEQEKKRLRKKSKKDIKGRRNKRR